MKKIRPYIFLHLLLFFFSFCSVFSKLASNSSPFSNNFFIFYGLSLLILGVYAILWQQVLKKMTLTIAFINKAVTIIWGMILGFLIFHEPITYSMIIGSIIVLSGILLVVMDNG
ncbi:MAG: EamA family transporter [Bacilli bacterium]